MKNLLVAFAFFAGFISLSAQEAPSEIKTNFDEASLQQTVEDLEGNVHTIGEILEKHKGKIIYIDIWASWCPDCIKGLPKLEDVQKQYPELVYLFLSLDRKQEAWKKAIDKYQLKGEHYWFHTEWKNNFTDYIGLNWIPRYMLVDQEGKIAHFYAIHADDAAMLETLVELNIIPAE